MSEEGKGGRVLVRPGAGRAEGPAELAGQIGGGTVAIATAGGTDDGRIGTSIVKVQRALALADAGAGVVILPDLGSSVLTVRALLAESEDLPEPIAVADAPFVEGAVAATGTAPAGGGVKGGRGAAAEGRAPTKT